MNSRKLAMGVLLILPTIVFSQISLGGKPYSLLIDSVMQSGFNNSARTEIPKSKSFIYNSINNYSEKARSQKLEASCENCRSKYFGSGIDLDIDIKKDGEKTVLNNGTLYKIDIESKTAFGISFYFDNYELPKTAALFIYNEDKSRVLGAFTHINNRPDRKFTTANVPGSKITLEYFEENDSEFEGKLHLYRIVHAFYDIHSEPFDQNANTGGKSTSNSNCFEDITCEENYQDLRKGVCRIAYYDSNNQLAGARTGFLVNSTDPFKSSYVLTAAHGLSPIFSDDTSSEQDFSEWVFEFGYESFTCDLTTPKAGVNSHNGSRAVTGAHPSLPGATADYFLVDLQLNNIENHLDIVKLGWTKQTSNIFGSVGISHPLGLLKKIAFTNTTEYVNEDGMGSEWKVTWSSGHQEEGASGSPLISSQGNKVMGLLRYGDSQCGNGYDKYQSISHLWDKYDNNVFTYSLGNYLDYNNEGLESLDHFIPEDDDGGNGNGGGPNCSPNSIYQLASTIGEPDFIIADFNICDSYPCFGGGEASCDGFYTSHGIVATLGNCNKLRMDEFSGIITSFQFNKDQEIIFTYDLYNMESSGEKVKFIATNIIPNFQCGTANTSPVSIDWSQSQLISEINYEYWYDQVTNNSPDLFNPAVKFGSSFTPNKDYSYLWVIYEDDQDPNINQISIDNLLIHSPENFNTSELKHPNSLGLQEWSIIFGDDLEDDYLAAEYLNVVSIGSSSPTVRSGKSATFESKSITLGNGFTVEPGGELRITARGAMVSDDPYNPSGPLIDESYYNQAGSAMANVVDEYSANYSDEESLFSENKRDDVITNTNNSKSIDRILIYPNPATQTLKLTSERIIDKLEIIDLSGKVLVSKAINNTIDEIDIGGLKNGIFIVKIITNEGKSETFRVKIDR